MEEKNHEKFRKKLSPLRRIFLETSFIVFLFYSNLLMGEYTHSGLGQTKGLLWAMEDMFTLTNFVMAITLALIGYVLFDHLLHRT